MFPTEPATSTSRVSQGGVAERGRAAASGRAASRRIDCAPPAESRPALPLVAAPEPDRESEHTIRVRRDD
ncbi:MAG TPA: hypothetical protein VFS05_15685 [Gemmatimonadaceae bacterium]|nr:hypothetical protein [Gemmatimonadaceae bacterium]